MAHEHIVYMMLAESAANLRDAPALRRYASILETLTLRDDHKPYLAIAHRAWGIACTLDGKYDDAEARLSQALALFRELEAPWQIGRTYYEMGQLDLARSERATAQHHFLEAVSHFETMKAVPDADRVRAALAEIGEM